MKPLSIFQTIAEQINLHTDENFELMSVTPISGGDINTAYRLQGLKQWYFVKLNRPNLLPMFIAEVSGLIELGASQTIKTPRPIIAAANEGHAYIVLEYLHFGASTPASSRLFGEQLAQLHQQPQAFFGWYQDNTIGSTPQPNPQSSDWVIFWREQRLNYQLQLAHAKGYGGRLQKMGAQLSGQLEVFFSDYQPTPSLLHGDLWAGNTAVDSHGLPIIFDPACYYGDRETDLAMTQLFGGFNRDFYDAYNSTWPLDQGFAIRKTLYNLYHILNHLNLFGGSYAKQAENMLEKLLAEIR